MAKWDVAGMLPILPGRHIPQVGSQDLMGGDGNHDILFNNRRCVVVPRAWWRPPWSTSTLSLDITGVVIYISVISPSWILSGRVRTAR